jgi:hypothetical protein
MHARSGHDEAYPRRSSPRVVTREATAGRPRVRLAAAVHAGVRLRHGPPPAGGDAGGGAAGRLSTAGQLAVTACLE